MKSWLSVGEKVLSSGLASCEVFTIFLCYRLFRCKGEVPPSNTVKSSSSSRGSKCMVCSSKQWPKGCCAADWHIRYVPHVPINCESSLPPAFRIWHVDNSISCKVVQNSKLFFFVWKMEYNHRCILQARIWEVYPYFACKLWAKERTVHGNGKWASMKRDHIPLWAAQTALLLQGDVCVRWGCVHQP